jgi:ribonuclease-3
LRHPVEQLCRGIQYQFSDDVLLQTALTHRSASSRNNERLEYLGDAILGAIISDELYGRFPNLNEGQLSRLRSSLVKKESLAQVARGLELGDYLLLGSGELRSGGQSRDSIIADALEALLAAVYLDGGYIAAQKVILRLFNPRIAVLSPEAEQKDPKSRLQEHLQAQHLSLPDYSIVEVTGDPHDQLFVVKCVVVDISQESIGRGSSRQKAEQDAAAILLRSIHDD